MSIEQLAKELELLGVSRFCFRFRAGKYEAMIVNREGDVFGLGGDTITEATTSLLNALKTKNILGSDGWEELMNPSLN